MAAKSLTATPRRYGFHATLKAPFHLASGCTLDELIVALDEGAKLQHRFVLPQLRVTQLDNFLALSLARECPDADRTAAWCVTHFDRFRAPLTNRELSRRRHPYLTDAENLLLEKWGYPYLLDRFRFHFSLTGSLAAVDEESRTRLQSAASHFFDAMVREPLVFDSVSIFEESSSSAPFRLLHRAGFA